jgi:hypothetical protein
MTRKQIKLHRQTYENAGAMLRAGLWDEDYAAFHYSEVAETLNGYLTQWACWIAFRRPDKED